jgi:DNA-binding MarR family transcriptional regulator
LTKHVKIDTGLDIESEMNSTGMFRDIMHLKHELNNLANGVAATLDLRGSEMAIIDTLGRFGALTMSELAAACFFSPPNATYTVRSLEKNKLLKRTRSKNSQRVVIVDLTPSGKAVFRQSYPSTLHKVNGFFDSKLSKNERKRLAKLLNKLAT